MKTMRLLMGMMSAVLAVSVLAEDPSITNVVVRQRWPWSRLVDIDYVLACDTGAQRVDVALTAREGTETLTLPTASLSGDRRNVAKGARRIVWDPMKTAYTNDVLARFSVELVPTPVPLYMIVDLTNTVGTAAHIEYVYEKDLTNGLWGSWVRNPITNAAGAVVVESVVWTGVATNETYKTDKLVLRRVHAGPFKMGTNQDKSVNLTKDFYAGVFEMTDAQWAKVKGTGSGTSMPKSSISYNDLRGATNSVPPIDWPVTGDWVLSNSFIGILRATTGLQDFDLPTEAQWEYFCRAGTTSIFHDGLSYTQGTSTDDQLSLLAWWKVNSGNAAHTVGGKLPNAWGLYDTHGNVSECCLDWYGTLEGGDDPDGPIYNEAEHSPPYRSSRGFAYNTGSAGQNYQLRSGVRGIVYPHVAEATRGFRLVLNFP